MDNLCLESNEGIFKRYLFNLICIAILLSDLKPSTDGKQRGTCDFKELDYYILLMAGTPII